MTEIGHNSGDDDTFSVSEEQLSLANESVTKLRQFIERIERLEEEKKGISDDIKDVYGEVKATGFDAKGVRKIIAERKIEPDKRREMAAILEVYRDALGMD